MTSKAEKLLEKMRQSPNNWKRNDLESLYTGFGFIIVNSRGPHDKVFHPNYPVLITSLPRHTELGIYNIRQAIKLIERLKLLELSSKER